MEDLLPICMPVAVYWIASAIYEYFLYPGEENRLFFDEKETTNIPTPKQVVLGTLLNHAMQMTLAAFHFMVAGGAGTPKIQSGYLQTAGQIAVATLAFDAWQYFWHRLMHENKFLFKHVHAVHHRLIVPYSYGAQYHTVAEAFGADVLGSGFAMLVSGMSPTASALFFSTMSLKAVDDHCGKWFPNSNPFHRYLHNNSAFHGVHHQVHGFKYNYSNHFLVTWDMILGTYSPVTVGKRKGGGYIVRSGKDD
ncbi:sphinganine C4-monooxygenase 1-like [Wolffia australiana]